MAIVARYPVAMSAIGTGTFDGGEPAVPKVLISPVAAWMTPSTPGLWRCAPDCP
jgi:hypothetical protein